MDQHAGAPAPFSPPQSHDYEGYIDQRSTCHIAGWARDTANPQARLKLEIIGSGGRVLATTTADRFDDQTIAALGSRDANYAFNVIFNAPVTEAERHDVSVRITGTTHLLQLAPALSRNFEPINHIAADIVNNCNLRCPFCVVDYAGTNRTEFMTQATFEALLALFPYVRDGNVWLSCLHEATLHPHLLDFIGQVPRQYRKKIMFTTNLAKRLSGDFFHALANSGIDHLNISVESLRPDIYELMRAGARHHIFTENLEKLWQAFAGTPTPPALRYIILAYRSNLSEIPGLVQALLEKPATAEIEVRGTINKPHIPQDFRDNEFLTSRQWRALDQSLARLGPGRLVKLFPPGLTGYDEDQSVEPSGRPFQPGLSPAPLPLNLRLAWDGALTAFSQGLGVRYFEGNLNDMPNAIETLLAL